MKVVKYMNRIIYLLFTLLIVLGFLYIQSQYIIDITNIESDLSELTKEEISIMQSFQIEKTSSTVFIFKSSLTTGYVILTKHPFLNKLKVTRVQNDIEEKNSYTITTNHGKYIVTNRDLNNNLITMNDHQSFKMKLLNEEFQMYISEDTIPKKYTDEDILD